MGQSKLEVALKPASLERMHRPLRHKAAPDLTGISICLLRAVNSRPRPHHTGDSAVLRELTFVPYIQILSQSASQTDRWTDRGREEGQRSINGSCSFIGKNTILKSKNMRHPEAG